MAGIEYADVARLLTAEEFARHELLMKGNRAKCPFHDGRDFNLAFFKRDGRCHCFVCGKGGDVVTLAAATWHVSQMDAARMLNDEYRLGLAAESPTDEQRQARQHERDQREQARRREAETWAAACDEERAAQAAIEKFTAADADKPEFTQALKRLAAAHTALDAMQAGY